MAKGYLVLETGDVFVGTLLGSCQSVLGEVVFNTSMTGYQEIITDPSYAGQIVVFCYPLIGNYGVNLACSESSAPQLAGIVVGELCDAPSHYLANQTVAQHLTDAGVTGIADVDTRALVKIIRNQGTVKGWITKEPNHAFANGFHSITRFWVAEVSTKKVATFGSANSGPHIALVDYGFKKSILAALLEHNCKVTVVPYSFSFEQMMALNPDGVLFSNGPGDPTMLREFLPEIKEISKHYPCLGICLGHQVLALAHNCQTSKLKYGHRGGNHPVKELATGKVLITSQNHGYVVELASVDLNVFSITHLNINDGTVEGLKHKTLPIQTIQFHPEAHPGPGDSAKVFFAFINSLNYTGDMTYAVT